MIDKTSDITEVKFGNCNDIYVRKGNNKQSNPWYGWKNNAWNIVSASSNNNQQKKAFIPQAIDTQGNFWFFDLSQTKKYLKFYNSDSRKVQ